MKGANINSARVSLVYILAASHSGSTLLSLLLGAHPEVCTVGELKATNFGDPQRYLCSCGERIRSCAFWKAIKEEMAKQGIDFDITNSGTNFHAVNSPYCKRLLAPLHRGPLLERMRDLALWLSPLWRRHLDRVQRRNHLLMKSVLRTTGKEVLVDSSKIGLRLKYLLRNPDLDIKVIWLVRDGRAVTLTYMEPALYADAKDPRLRDGGTGGTREREKRSIHRAVHEWVRSNEEAATIVRTMPKDKWIRIRYEDYCKDPEAKLKRLFEFIGVDAGKWPWPEIKTYEHHIIGNGMRLDWDGSVRLDERWKDALTSKDLAIFDKIAGSMNRKLGYQ